jgi:hypothetical protein
MLHVLAERRVHFGPKYHVPCITSMFVLPTGEGQKSTSIHRVPPRPVSKPFTTVSLPCDAASGGEEKRCT